MFCPSCGAEYAIGLNYCNRCGANLSAPSLQAESAPVSVTKPAIVITIAIMFITLVGFAAVTEGATKLGALLHENDPVVVTIIFGMGTIMVIDIMLIMQLSRLIGAFLGRPGQAKKLSAKQKAKELPAPDPGAFVPAGSVTDHTTRTLDRQPVTRN
jgi:hypothetical protein